MYTIKLHIVFISTSIEIVNRRNPGEVVSGNIHLTNFSDLTAVDPKPNVVGVFPVFIHKIVSV